MRGRPHAAYKHVIASRTTQLTCILAGYEEQGCVSSPSVHMLQYLIQSYGDQGSIQSNFWGGSSAVAIQKAEETSRPFFVPIHHLSMPLWLCSMSPFDEYAAADVLAAPAQVAVPIVRSTYCLDRHPEHSSACGSMETPTPAISDRSCYSVWV